MATCVIHRNTIYGAVFTIEIISTFHLPSKVQEVSKHNVVNGNYGAQVPMAGKRIIIVKRSDFFRWIGAVPYNKCQIQFSLSIPKLRFTVPDPTCVLYVSKWLTDQAPEKFKETGLVKPFPRSSPTVKSLKEPIPDGCVSVKKFPVVVGLAQDPFKLASKQTSK